MKLLIADDDEQIRSGMEQGIDWSALDIQQVITASNGFEAMQFFSELCPEIVVTDVRMPGLDGLELLRQIKKINPQTRVVILSGYNDFEYLKKAIQLDAVDYELKPIRARSLIALIQRIKEDIDRERMTEQEFNKYLASYKTKFAEELLTGSITDRLILLEGLQKYYGFEATGALVCVSVQLDDKRNQSGDLSEAAMNTIYRLFESSELSSQGICLELRAGELVFLMRTETRSYLFYQQFVNELVNLLGEWNRKTKPVCQTSFSAGISGSGSVSEIVRLYHEANQALSMRLYEGNGSVKVYDRSCELNDGMIVGLLENGEFIGQLSRGDFNSAAGMVHREFDRIKKDRQYSRKSLSAYCRNLLQLFLVTARNVPADVTENIRSKMEFIEEGTYSLSIDRFREIVAAVFEHAGTRCSKDLSPVMIRADKFIRKHFTGDLTVEMLAGHVGKTPNYFSHLFKREFGIPFREYVNRLRVDKAKELIIHTNDLIYEISQKVGFSDYTYFTQVFKKIEGYPPASLRKQPSEAAVGLKKNKQERNV
jgi:two-component system response regulator YesN